MKSKYIERDLAGHTAMTCRRFSAILENVNYFNEELSEDAHSKTYRPQTYRNLLVLEAQSRGITLVDIHTFDYETYYWDMLQDY